MKNRSAIFVLLCGLTAMPVSASEACRGYVIQAAADVSVSDGSGFRIETFFSGVDEAAIRFVDDNELVVAVEGDWAWVSQNGRAERAGESQKAFALGHQFHALLMYFDELAENRRSASDVAFGETGEMAAAGDYPYGGAMYLIAGDDERPKGMVFELSDAPRIEVRFDDWRSLDDTSLPFDLRIDDGRQVFRYRYDQVQVAGRTDTWFQDHVTAPDIAEIMAHRAALRDSPDSCN